MSAPPRSPAARGVREHGRRRRETEISTSNDERRETTSAAGPIYLGIFADGPGRVVIVLGGDVDAAGVLRLGETLRGFVAGRPRCVTIDATAVGSYAEGLLDLLTSTHRRLARHQGLLSVRGLGLGLSGGSADRS